MVGNKSCYILRRTMELSKPFNNIKIYALKKSLPLIAIQAKDVSIIPDPPSFYKTILDKIESSHHRLALSALYLGTGPKEKAIVQAIYNQVQKNKNLDINIILDANRVQRKDELGQSSLSILGKILTFSRVKLNLVETGNDVTIFSRVIGRVKKWREILSTYHSKVMIFDKDTLVTGANLSNIYFEKRQDRYMLIKNSKLLSNYLYDLLGKINNENESVGQIVRGHNDLHLCSSTKNESDENSDSFIIPLVQCGQAGLTDKEDFLQFLDSILPEYAEIYMSSGYFNPSPVISKLKISSVLAPSEQANGFFNGGGFLKFVPRLYTALYKQYIEAHNQCKLFLFDKPGWSFHSKGVWIEGLDDLYIHIIGSSNYGWRSSQRDLEIQLVLLTRNKDLVAKLQNERIELWKESSRLDVRNMTELNSIYTMMSRILKSFL